MTMKIDRRSALLLVGGSLLAGAASSGAAATSKQTKAEKFLWGSAGAAYQIEGGNYASDLWVMEHTKPSIFKDPSGDAVDAYNRVNEDIALAASLGFNTHRFSIEWSRIEPERGRISNAAIAYYRRVLETIRKHGMTPFVTFNHFTTPRWFAAAGGFETRDGIEPFVNYCSLIARELGDLIGIAATFNEPNLGALVSWSPAIRPLRPHIVAARELARTSIGAAKWSPPMLSDFRIQQPIMIEAHNRAYDAIKQASAGRFPVGVTLSLNDERGSAEAIARKQGEVMLPWLAANGDYIGVQNYTYSVVEGESDLPPERGIELTQMGYPFAPEALEGVIRAVARHSNRPIYVTENGVATEDDTRRVAFIDRAVAGVSACLRDGIDVRGYIHWSLLDNWEWVAGFGPKFGLVSVDRTTFVRTAKPSAHHLGRMARRGSPPG
ncbi:beta-glucosidase [Steroidobacter agaridevorans]|uniref:Beta-glucosidase n=1 Tax=Steroidobacter agaridevorans TaxID=2695856 RepID=A0A829YKD2_9GAMM|nr:family 1 glycosylhydrolase [Steroidobacter agaridevorans]GFE83311.1 beta-glucosidase [Steroidobacter agaridevorans]